MKKLTIAVILLVVLGGCSGVWMNAEYSQLLDETVAMSLETAGRAEAGRLTADQMARALRLQAETWQRLQMARDGVSPEEDE